MVTASFKEGQKTAITTSLQKYDYGEVLRIKGLSLPRYVAVQFAVDGMSEALPSSIGETVEDVTDVLIPNSLLRSNIKPWNYNIMAYVYIVSGSSGKTKYTITIPVKWRPKTGDDQAADDDVAAVIGSAVEKMNTATTKAENAANQASATADEIKADREKITTNEAKISGLQSDLPNYLKVKETVLETDNLLDINDLTVGYVTLDGRIYSRDGFKYTRLEPVTPNMTYTVWRMIWRNNFEARFVTFYDKEKNVISNAGVEMATSFTTTDNTYYVIMTFTDNENITLDREPMVTEGTELPTEYKPYRNEFVDYVTEYVKKVDFDSAVKEIDEKIKNTTLTTHVNCAY